MDASAKLTSKNPRDNLDKIRTHLTDTCYRCGKGFSTAGYTIRHVKTAHGFNIPPRARSMHRIQDPRFEYVMNKDDKFAIEEIACPCCWKHFPKDDLEALYDHTIEEHDPVKIGAKSDSDDEGYYSGIDSSRAPVPRRYTSDVQQPAAVGEKVITVAEAAMIEVDKKFDEFYALFKNLLK